MLGMTARAIWLATALLAAGCATTTTTGRAIDAQAAAKLQPGTTTIAEAKALLGAPFQSMRTSDGRTLLTYARTTVTQHGLLATSADVDSETLVLVFNAAGILVSTSGGASATSVK